MAAREHCSFGMLIRDESLQVNVSDVEKQLFKKYNSAIHSLRQGDDAFSTDLFLKRIGEPADDLRIHRAAVSLRFCGQRGSHAGRQPEHELIRTATRLRCLYELLDHSITVILVSCIDSRTVVYKPCRIQLQDRTMVRKQETKGLLLRQDVKAWLEKEAARTLASQNSEIVRCIRARMDADQPKRAIQTYLTAPLSFSRAVD